MRSGLDIDQMYEWRHELREMLLLDNRGAFFLQDDMFKAIKQETDQDDRRYENSVDQFALTACMRFVICARIASDLR